MATQLLTERVADLGAFRAVKAAGAKLPLLPLTLAHVYVKLDFKPESENAATIDEAQGFLRSVARAAIAADHIAQMYNGLVLEVQGSTLHVGLQQGQWGTLMDSAYSFVSDLHWVYREIFVDQKKRVQGWRMTVDTGKTLVVAGRGVHHDDSYVSLGNSANRPAKHLYAQLTIPNEEDRALKRYFMAVRDPHRGRWYHEDLHRKPRRLDEAVLRQRIKDVQQADLKITFLEAGHAGWKQATARALPIAPAGSPAAPSPEKPHAYFGWVMRADLDGFTKRVQDCLDNDHALQELGQQFYCIMDAAAEFAVRHQETLAQLPWAGDNFTAPAVFTDKAAYDEAISKRLVDLTLDFEKDMKDAAVKCGFGGWAHGVAGGETHGNAAGNVFIAGIEVDQRRFLVGVGEGVGRSTEAFGDVNPKAHEMVLYGPDWARLHKPYKDAFERAVNVRGQESTLYYKAEADGLLRVRAKEAAKNSAFTISFPREEPRQVPTRPHCR